MNIEHWGSNAKGRSTTVAHEDRAWTVSNARNDSGGFADQVGGTLAFPDAPLTQAGSSRAGLLTVQSILANIGDRDEFNSIGCHWIGDDLAHWPRRAIFGAALAPGLLLEIIATAARP